MACVLIVEDNDDVAESLAVLLEIAGHETRVVGDGLEALREAQRWLPDAVVLDIGLPLLDGVEVARRLRQRYGEAIRLIACSACADCGTQQRIAQAGFNVILTKPASPNALLTAIGEPPPQRRAPLHRRDGCRPRFV